MEGQILNIISMNSRFFMRSKVFYCMFPISIWRVTNASSLLRHNVWSPVTSAVTHIWQNATSIYLCYSATKEFLVPIWVKWSSSFSRKSFRKVYMFRLFLLWDYVKKIHFDLFKFLFVLSCFHVIRYQDVRSWMFLQVG